MAEKLDTGPLIEVLQEASRVAVLTGAGISAESGIPTFRGEEGLWKKYRPEELATPAAFSRDPKFVWEWYDWRRGIFAQKEPNPGHEVIARWEKTFPTEKSKHISGIMWSDLQNLNNLNLYLLLS